MKKYISTVLLTLVVVLCNAQIYQRIVHYDKFDDIVKTEQRKTLVTKTDSTFVFEEKGRNPVVYYVLNPLKEGTLGSKDNIVNLINDVYGYQETWCVVREDMKDKYIAANAEFILNPSKENMKKVQPYWLFIIHRTVTTQYTGNFLDDLIWIQDDYSDGKLGKDVNRIIYLQK